MDSGLGLRFGCGARNGEYSLTGCRYRTRPVAPSLASRAAMRALRASFSSRARRRHLLDRLELLAMDEIHVAQNALGLALDDGIDFPPHACERRRRRHSSVSQIRHKAGRRCDLGLPLSRQRRTRHGHRDPARKTDAPIRSACAQVSGMLGRAGPLAHRPAKLPTVRQMMLGSELARARFPSIWPLMRVNGPPEQVHAYLGHPVPEYRSGAGVDRTVRDPLVCPRLHLRHLAGLALCPRHDPQRAALGRPGAADGRRLRRFRAVGDARASSSAAASAMCCSTICRISSRHPVEILRGVERRHVVPWRLSRLRRRGDRFCPSGAGCRSLRSATSLARSAPIGLLLGRLANFINGELWGRVTEVPWAMIFPRGGPLPRHPSQLYEAGLEGLLLAHRSRAHDPRRRAAASWPHPRLASRRSMR